MAGYRVALPLCVSLGPGHSEHKGLIRKAGDNVCEREGDCWWGKGSLLSGDESANKTQELPGSRGQMHM